MPLFRTLLATCLTTCLAFTSSATMAAPKAAPKAEQAKIDRETPQRTDMRLQIEAAWRADDFKTLETMGQDILKQHSKTYNGMSKLGPYYFDIGEQLQITWPSVWNIVIEQDNCHCEAPDPARYDEAERRWNAVASKLNAWSRQYPDSNLAPVARIHYLIRRAWFYRGTVYGSKVNPKAWPRFQQYINEADKTVQASKAIRSKNPEWFGYAVQVATAAGWPEAERAHIYAEMPKLAQLYPLAYSRALQFMQPKWHGNLESMHELVAATLQQAPKDDGTEFYARLYWILLDDDDQTLKIQSQTDVDKALLKKGFNLILQRYPEPWNYIGAAKTACRIGDQEMFDQATHWLGTYDRFHGKQLAAIDCANDDFSPGKAVTAH